MVEIQSPTAKIRRGKEEERRRTNDRMKIYMTCPITLGGHKRTITRMWANAQRDGRPAEHKWRPLFNAAKFS